jgi:hypothetical protein
VEVRARVSKGGNLEMIVVGEKDLDLGASIRRARQYGWPFKTPVVPGDDFQTYAITDTDSRIPSFSASTTRHVLPPSPTLERGPTYTRGSKSFTSARRSSCPTA